MTENTYRWTYDGLERLVDEVFETNLDDLVNGLESLGLEDAASLPASSRAGRDYHDHYTFDLTGNRLSKSTDEDLDGIADRWVDSTYDANDRLRVERQFINTLQGLPGPMPVSERTDYAYDHTQQIDKSVYRGDPPTVSNRLSSLQFQYDLQGRLEISTSTTYSPTDGTQVLTQQRTTYDYDTTGIRVTALTETDNNGDSVFDTRVKTEWLNDPQNFTGYSQVIRETHTTLGDGTNPDRLDKTVIYTFGLDEISQTTATPQPDGSVSSTTHTFLHDGHGSVRALLDAAQALARVSIAPSAPAILQLFTFDAYGNAIAFRESSAATTLLYSGEQFDQRVMMQYLRARYYDGASGRFVGLDPYSGNSQDPQSFHKYLYTHANPIGSIDPTGLYNAISMGVSVGVMSGLSGMAVGAVHGAVHGYQQGGLWGAVPEGAEDAVVYGLIGAVSGFIVGVAGYGAGVGLSYGAARFFGVMLPARIAVLGVMRVFQAIFTLEAAHELLTTKDEADAAAAFTAILLTVGGPKLVEKIPFWPKGGSWRAIQSRINNFIGAVGEDVMILRYLKAGYELVARQVSFRASDGTVARADAVMRHKATGRLRTLDSKTGDGDLRPAQRKVYTEIQNGTAKPIGENARQAGLTQADFPAGSEVQVEEYGAFWRLVNTITSF